MYAENTLVQFNHTSDFGRNDRFRLFISTLSSPVFSSSTNDHDTYNTLYLADAVPYTFQTPQGPCPFIHATRFRKKGPLSRTRTGPTNRQAVTRGLNTLFEVCLYDLQLVDIHSFIYLTRDSGVPSSEGFVRSPIFHFTCVFSWRRITYTFLLPGIWCSTDTSAGRESR